MKTKFNLPDLQMLFFSFALIFNLLIFNLQSSDAQMFWNQACRFQGLTSSYVSVPNSSSLNITGSFSIEYWMLPQSVAGIQTIVSKGSTTPHRYGIQLINNRVAILTDGIIKVQSAPFTPFVWTHVTGTYSSSTHQFRIYRNGILDTFKTDIGSQPNSTIDSLFIGSLPSSAPFLGKLDEVRIWNKSLSATEISQYFRTSLSASSGIYNGLVMSLTFQGKFSILGFVLDDLSGNGNNGFNRGVFAFDQSNIPNHTITQNESVELDGSDDYLAAPDNNNLNPPFAITLECWVYPRNINPCIYITKGTDYRLGFNGSVITFGINNNFFSTGVRIPTNQWSHLALSYSGNNGIYTFYLNGNLSSSSTISVGNPNNGTDSLFIEGGPGFGDLNGFIDEVRILVTTRSRHEINQFLYQSLDVANQPSPGSYFNFDGSLINSSNFGDKLFFRNNARFSHPGCIAVQPISPLNRNDTSFTKGYYMNTSNKRIPSAGTSGTITDSTIINLNTTVTDVNLFVALNHTNSSSLDIILVGPNGDSVKVFNNNVTNSSDNNLITIFNDQADSSMINNRYCSFSPVIKPENKMNTTFNGDNTFGKWRLIVRDEATNDSGFLYAWGIQINNLIERSKDLNLSALVQGFYNPATNFLAPDTMRVILRHRTSPFPIVILTKIVLNNEGLAFLNYSTGAVINTIPYYIQLQHRNSIETWSNNTFTFEHGEATYSFIDSAGAAFGSNQIQVDNSPVKFAIYGGDVNQDGVVDATDAGAIDNDATNFVTGYVKTDLTGDDVTDASDAAIADNNAFNFVTKITP